jgi:hypothetical protein
LEQDLSLVIEDEYREGAVQATRAGVCADLFSTTNLVIFLINQDDFPSGTRHG